MFQSIRSRIWYSQTILTFDTVALMSVVFGVVCLLVIFAEIVELNGELSPYYFNETPTLTPLLASGLLVVNE